MIKEILKFIEELFIVISIIFFISSIIMLLINIGILVFVNIGLIPLMAYIAVVSFLIAVFTGVLIMKVYEE